MIRIFYREKNLVEHAFNAESWIKDKFNLIPSGSGYEVCYEVFIKIYFIHYKKYPYTTL